MGQIGWKVFQQYLKASFIHLRPKTVKTMKLNGNGNSNLPQIWSFVKKDDWKWPFPVLLLTVVNILLVQSVEVRVSYLALWDAAKRDN